MITSWAPLPFNLVEHPLGEGDYFVAAHVLSPHPPCVFAADGSPINPDDPYTLLDADDFRKRESTRAYLDGYREQLAYLNRLVLESVEGILEQSTEPPIIILAGVHGSGVLTEHHSLEATNVKERFSILHAYYLPGEGEGGLYPSITPANAFRVIFNRYFGTDLPLLPDLSFFAEGETCSTCIPSRASRSLATGRTAWA